MKIKQMTAFIVAMPLLLAGCGGGDGEERKFSDSEPRAFYNVEYEVTTTPAFGDDQAYVTYTSPGQTSELHKVVLPATISAPLMYDGSVLYISAQSTNANSQSIRVAIKVNGQPYRHAEGVGPYAQATASAMCCTKAQ